jgi:hypothetical protein
MASLSMLPRAPAKHRIRSATLGQRVSLIPSSAAREIAHGTSSSPLLISNKIRLPSQQGRGEDVM